MHVLNVNSTLGLRTGGGTAERTLQMSRFLAAQGVQCTVMTLDIELDEERKRLLGQAKLVSIPCVYKRFYIPGLAWNSIKQLVKQADIVHLMGHWGLLNALTYLVARHTNTPYVVCPAGALPMFGRSKILKILYNLAIGSAIIKNASGWIAVTAGEFSHFELYGIPSNKVTVLPNGVSEEKFSQSESERFLKQYGLSNKPFILFMGRLNLIKGPDLLLQAFISICQNFPEYHLVFAGPDGGMLLNLKSLVSESDMSHRVHFLGYIDGEDKTCAYHAAKLLVVPSRQEAMSIVALEAGICGTPVLLTDQCGFSEISQIDSRLEVPATAEGIAVGISSLLADDQALQKITPMWRGFVACKYAWSSIIPEYIKLYDHLLDSGIS